MNPNGISREIELCNNFVIAHPDDPMALASLAYLHNLERHEDEAYTHLNEALRINPDHEQALQLKSMMYLQRDKWHEGWPNFKFAFFKKGDKIIDEDAVFSTNAKKWDGKPTDEPVLLWSEEGFGDQILFIRFFKLAKKLAPNAFLEVFPELFELFDYSETRRLLGLKPSGDLYRLRRTVPSFTYHANLTRLPALFDVGEDEIKTDPYLDVDPRHVATWLGKGNHSYHLPYPMEKMPIGICAVSNPDHGATHRDIPDKFLEPIFNKYGPVFSLEQRRQHFDCFASTAAAIKTLKLVITVDTSIAHLAGALGTPVWLLLPWYGDWKWGFNETTTWYDGMRIFRQSNKHDWKEVVDCVMTELSKLKL